MNVCMHLAGLSTRKKFLFPQPVYQTFVAPNAICHSALDEKLAEGISRYLQHYVQVDLQKKKKKSKEGVRYAGTQTRIELGVDM